jgi:hypothetical protein
MIRADACRPALAHFANQERKLLAPEYVSSLIRDP